MIQGLAALFFGKGKTYPPTLSARAKAHGRKLIWRFYLLNGISVALLMDNILILYALRNNVSEPVVAVMTSFVHLTMPFMIIGKIAASRIGLTRTWSLGWFLRYISASAMILAPVIAPLVSQRYISLLILLSALGFALFRSMGIVASNPMEGEITSPENRGEFLSGNQLRVNISQVVTMLLVITITRYVDGVWVYQLLIGAACLIGVYASTVLARIPESSVPRASANIPFKTAFKRLWGESSSRKLLFDWSGALTAYMMVIPFMMIGLKSGYGISDYSALSFSLILLVGGIVSSAVNGMIADQVGPRPILMLNAAMMFIPALIWAAAPAEFMPLLIGLGFFVSGYAKFGMIMGLSHYFLSIVSGSDRVGSTLFLRVFSGAAAGLSGTIIGGGLLRVFELLGFSGLSIYRNYFRIILAVLLIVFLLVRSLERLQEWKLSSVLSLLASPKDMYTLHLLKRLRGQDSSSEDVRTLKRLQAVGSSISEDELRNQLDAPLLSVRFNALQALSSMKLGERTLEAVKQQLVCGEHTTAWIAAEILGKNKAANAVKPLRQGLESGDRYLQGKCMVALVNLGDEISYPRIEQMFDASSNPRIVIHGARALSMTGAPDKLGNLLEKSLDTQLPSTVIDELLTTAASTAGMQQRFYSFIKRFNKDSQVGTAEIVSELDQGVFDPDELAFLTQKFSGSDHARRLTGMLMKKAALVDDSGAVHRFLARHAEEVIPVKTLLCIALILSAGPPRPKVENTLADRII
jgi:MFS family permease